MALSVPERAHAGLKVLASLTDEQVDRLSQILSETPPAASSARLAADVASRVSDSDMSASEARSTVRALITLYIGREVLDLDITEFCQEISEALREIEDFRSFKDEAWSALGKRLERFLAMDHPLGITSKAMQIMMDHEHLFCGARVFTDVRSVFGDDVTEKPEGAVIMHMLSVHYHNGPDHKETFYALNTQDIDKLIEVLERAKMKAETLQTVLEDSKIPHLRVE